MTWKHMAAYFASCAITLSAVGGATYLIANGHEHGWGWLILIAILSIPSWKDEK